MLRAGCRVLRIAQSHRARSTQHAALLFFCALPIFAQHDISKVDPAPPNSVIATPLPEEQRRMLRKYDIPDLAGAQQALGSQLIDGHLPRPKIDFITRDGGIEQRVSLFEGGLVVINMTGAGTIFKRVIIPPDALAAYAKAASAASLRSVDQSMLAPPEADRRSQLRVYEDGGGGKYVERVFHPGRVLPKALVDAIAPLRDLVRAISEDRQVTTSLAGYEPQEGDELVADDHNVYRVARVMNDTVVQLKCLTAPTTIYIDKKDLSQFFIGKHAPQE